MAAPQTRWEINPRFDTMIGSKNTLTVRYSYEQGTSHNPGGGNSLTSQASSSSSSDNTVQISDTQLLSDRVINETRFEFEHEPSSSVPVNPATRVSVVGGFTANGLGSGSTSDSSNHIEVQNYTSIQLTKNFIRLGGRLARGLCHEYCQHDPERVAELLVGAGSLHRSKHAGLHQAELVHGFNRSYSLRVSDCRE